MASARLEVGGVGACIGFGKAEGALDGADGGFREPLSLLVVRAAEVDGLRRKRRKEQDQRASVIVLGGLLDGKREREEAGTRAAVLLRDGQPEEAGLSEYAEDVVRVFAALVEFSGARGDLLPGDAPGSVPDELMSVGEFVVYGSVSVCLIGAGVLYRTGRPPGRDHLSSRVDTRILEC